MRGILTSCNNLTGHYWEFMTYLRQSIAEMEAGMFVPWQDAKRELGI
jgi:hypothetical protein